MSGPIDTSTDKVLEIAQTWAASGHPGLANLLMQLVAERDGAISVATAAVNRMRDFDPQEITRELARKAQEA